MKFKIGIGVIVKKSGKVLIGHRMGSHGANTWSFPGGHLEEEEGPERTASREVLEETGLEVNDLRPLGFTYDTLEDANSDYLTLFYTCNWKGGEPRVLEKDKCLDWRWVDWDELPRPLFIPIESLLRQGTNI